MHLQIASWIAEGALPHQIGWDRNSEEPNTHETAQNSCKYTSIGLQICRNIDNLKEAFFCVSFPAVLLYIYTTGWRSPKQRGADQAGHGTGAQLQSLKVIVYFSWWHEQYHDQ